MKRNKITFAQYYWRNTKWFVLFTIAWICGMPFLDWALGERVTFYDNEYRACYILLCVINAGLLVGRKIGYNKDKKYL